MPVFTLSSLGLGAWPTVEIADIGAMIEGTPRYQPLMSLGLARLSTFEPQAAERARLEAAGHRVYPHFLGDGNAATFHITRYPGCSSLLEPDPAVIDLFSHIGAAAPGGNFHVVRREPVQTTRLDDVACPAFDYVKIDIQGGELLVLRHGATRLAAAVAIECEVEFLPLYRDQPLFGDVQRFLAGQGFVFHKFLDIAGRTLRPVSLGNPAAPMGQALWADAIFVKDYTRLAGWQDDQLLKGALVMHEVYRSFDLALRLLAEFDRRTGARRAEACAAALSRAGSLPIHFMTIKTTV